MATVSTTQLVLLALAALFAGTVDAIAGGGGLVTVPALLAVGLPPHVALGTNKGQSVWGALSALVSFWRAGSVDRARARVTFPFGLLGSFGGAALVLLMPPDALRPLVLVLLVAVAAILTFRRPGARATESPGVPVAPAPPHAMLVAGIVALLIGAYDGFFGPGTGTFLIAAFTLLLGVPLVRASGDAKVVNFASNLAAVLIFARRGVVLWSVAIPMALAQMVGGVIGTSFAVRGGDKVVRRVVLAVVAALVVKITRDLWVEH